MSGSDINVIENAQFVFLDPEKTGYLVYMHRKSWIVNIVHCRMLGGFASIFPLVMVWPLVLPVLNKGHDQEE